MNEACSSNEQATVQKEPEQAGEGKLQQRQRGEHQERRRWIDGYVDLPGGQVTPSASSLKKLLFQLRRVVWIAAVQQATRPGINRDEVIGRMDDSGSPSRQQHQGGDRKNQQV